MLRLVGNITEIEELWPRIRELWLRIKEQEVALPVDHPAHTLSNLLNGREFLFVWEVDGEIESMVLGSFETYPLMKVFRLNGLSGKLGDHWGPALQQIETYAKQQGARGFEFWGRPGLGPFLRTQGYKIGMQHYIKRID